MPPADLPELVNPVKARMQAGDVALGMIVRLARSGDVVRIAKSTGHDFIFIDGQHSLFSLETIGHMAQVGLGCGTAVLSGQGSPIQPTVSDPSTGATANTYTVTATSKSGNTFTIARDASGNYTRSCTVQGKGSCPPSGSW